MKKLLYVNACVRGDSSRTARIAHAYLSALTSSGDYEVVERDLTQVQLPHFSADLFVEGEQKPPSPLTVELAEEFANAHHIVIAAPFWEFAFPAVVSCYIEHISLVGTTFRYIDTGSQGLCNAQSMVYLFTSGDILEEGDAIGTALLGRLCKLYGIPSFTAISAQGLDLPFVAEGETVAKAIEQAKEQASLTDKLFSR